MLIVVDQKTPLEAVKKLETWGQVILLQTSGITYDAISGHPDIFFCPLEDTLVVAPNLPASYIKILQEKDIQFVRGELPVGGKYPSTAPYNAVVTDRYVLHNFRYTDSAITQLADHLDLVHVNQGYCRCNLLALKDNHFITSDEGIFRVLGNYGFTVLKTDAAGIHLPGFDHGFFGGTAGLYEDTVFLNGSLGQKIDGESIRRFIAGLGYEIVELHDGPLFDGGGLFFLQ